MPTPVLTLDVSYEGCDSVISLRGEVDMCSALALEHVLGFTAHDAHVVIDAAELTFIDSAGLIALAAATSGREAGTTSIRNPSWQLRRLLAISPVAGLEILPEEVFS